MSTLYLSSRTEFIRSVDLDTGRNIALISIPDEMAAWLDIGLPRDTPTIPEPRPIGGRTFDIVVWWIEKGSCTPGAIEDVRGLLTDGGEMWAIVPREGEVLDELMGAVVLDVDDGIEPLMITAERDMVPIWVYRNR